MDKDYSDPGSLPEVISIGDVIKYVDKRGTSHQFPVRYIKFFEYRKDVDLTYGGQHLTAKKGETTCTVFDVENRFKTRDTEYPSRLIIKNCRLVH